MTQAVAQSIYYDHHPSLSQHWYELVGGQQDQLKMHQVFSGEYTVEGDCGLWIPHTYRRHIYFLAAMIDVNFTLRVTLRIISPPHNNPLRHIATLPCAAKRLQRKPASGTQGARYAHWSAPGHGETSQPEIQRNWVGAYRELELRPT